MRRDWGGGGGGGEGERGEGRPMYHVLNRWLCESHHKCNEIS
jgi:hypothetical protein